jgi:hypothetical protein
MSAETTTLPWTYGISWPNCQLVIRNGCFEIVRGPEIPAIEAIVHDIELALKAKLYYLAIIVCLTIPDVCAALEAEDGRINRSLYLAWYAKHAKAQAGGVDPEECWSLRCGMTHQGKMDIVRGIANRVVFTMSSTQYRFDGMTLKSPTTSAYVFDAESWCLRWVGAVREWYKNAQHNPIVQRNMQDVMQVRPYGLAPFIVGQPIIS